MPNSRLSWRPAVPPPPVSGAAVGYSGVGAAVAFAVLSGLGFAVIDARGVTVARGVLDTGGLVAGGVVAGGVVAGGLVAVALAAPVPPLLVDEAPFDGEGVRVPAAVDED
jgi:hypothetical protein